MSSISDYKSRVTGNIKSSTTNSMKRLLKINFKNSPSYYSVQVYTASTPLVSTPLDVWITEDSKTKQLNNIQSIPNGTLNFGDIVVWNGDYFITLIVSDLGGIYYSGSIQRCFSSIKWLDSLGSTKEAYFTIATSDQHGLGIEEGKVMILPSERRYITLQNNVDTLQIVKNQRFIFDSGKTWKVVSMNTLKTGLISMELEEIEFSIELDNLELRIANFYLHNYTLDITNGSSANLSIGDTLQLHVVTKDNGVVTSLPVTYTSLDVTKATVNSSGLITCVADGTVSVKASLTNDPTVFTIISIIVSAVIVPSNSINISSSSNSIKATLSQTITGQVMINGVVDSGKTIVWSLFGSDGMTSTTLATITSQTFTNVVLKANSVSPYRYGDVILKAVCIEDNTIIATKVIHIKSLI